MKKSIICLALGSSLMFSSCLGSYSAFNNLRDWNDGVTDNKFLDNLIFWGLNIVPVYGLFFLGDTIIFNVIEFWSGENPVAMNEGESETQVLAYKGSTYEMTATKNKFNIKAIAGEKEGNSLEMVYLPEDKSWNAVKDGELIKLSSLKDGLMLVYLPNGESIKIDPTKTKEEGLAQINEAVSEYRLAQHVDKDMETFALGN